MIPREAKNDYYPAGHQGHCIKNIQQTKLQMCDYKRIHIRYKYNIQLENKENYCTRICQFGCFVRVAQLDVMS